ncbi:MAG: hypothetical protein H0X37_24200 [Herpetosiphonaceae bacterium]|nr:hypothetical protein [Herpetosiphonaceae bacterium]
MSDGAETKRAPMAAAPMKYRPDGLADWGNMWDAFCVLAQEGGPPHREQMLYAQVPVDVQSPAYAGVVAELIRGIGAVSGLQAVAGPPGWVAVQCTFPVMADWLAEAIIEEHVQARSEGAQLLVPAGEGFELTGEIKNVITVVAKTTHYWQDHLPAEVKQLLGWQLRFARAKLWITTLLRREPI